MTAERWRVSVDRNVCQSTGMCVLTAERHFVLRGSHSEPVQDEIDPDDDVVEAAESCPTEAIRVTSAADGRVIAPEPY